MNREQFKTICKKTQAELKQYVVTKLKKHYDHIWVHKDFVYAEGTVPICLVAHLDTVHKEPPTLFIEEADRISSPQGIGGDDRCGVYAILQLIKKHNVSVLFCCDEEVGGIGALAFCSTSLAKQKEYQYLVELDRKGKTDAVFYDCDNPQFTDFILKTGAWHEDFGSFTDISQLAPEMGCAAVNLSCGYYDQHTLKEYVVPSEVDYCIDNVCKLIERTTSDDKFEYIEADYYQGYYGYKYKDYRGYNSYYYDDEETVFLIQYETELGTTEYEEIEAISEYEAIGRFLVTHGNLTYNHIFGVLDESLYKTKSAK